MLPQRARTSASAVCAIHSQHLDDSLTVDPLAPIACGRVIRAKPVFPSRHPILSVVFRVLASPPPSSQLPVDTLAPRMGGDSASHASSHHPRLAVSFHSPDVQMCCQQHLVPAEAQPQQPPPTLNVTNPITAKVAARARAPAPMQIIHSLFCTTSLLEQALRMQCVITPNGTSNPPEATVQMRDLRHA